MNLPLIFSFSISHLYYKNQSFSSLEVNSSLCTTLSIFNKTIRFSEIACSNNDAKNNTFITCISYVSTVNTQISACIHVDLLCQYNEKWIEVELQTSCKLTCPTNSCWACNIIVFFSCRRSLFRLGLTKSSPR